MQVTNTGTEATMAAIRLARAGTGRDHIIVIQGGFKGSHNDVALQRAYAAGRHRPSRFAGRVQGRSFGRRHPAAHMELVHVINFNDLESVRYVGDRYSIAALITEPILQNVGILKPQPGYLQGLRDLADQFGFVLKTGFRYSLGGYSQISGVRPDLVVYAKAMANGYPISALGGKRDLTEQIAYANPAQRPFVAGTYNGHSVSVAAAIATLERLMEKDGEVYGNSRASRTRPAERNRIPAQCMTQ